MLHFNEIPFKHIIETFYGDANRPNLFCGSVTKELEYCSNSRIVDFKIILTDFPDIDFQKLSTDQKYLWEISYAISTGECSRKLELKQPGAMSLSRWINTSSRFLRLYVSTKNPSAKLRKIVTYIMKVYGLFWFKIKKENFCLDEPKHLFWFMKAMRYLPHNLLKEVNKNIQINGYFAHSENILPAMLADEKVENRTKAVDKILQMRQKMLSKDEL